jgi:hypothetical protein
MGWEVRHGRRYYYKNERTGGRVVKQYYGKDEIARLAEGIDADARRKKQAEAAAISAERDKLAPVEEGMVQLDRACRLMIEAVLLSDGFHRHCRTWRRTGALQGRG